MMRHTFLMSFVALLALAGAAEAAPKARNNNNSNNAVGITDAEASRVISVSTRGGAKHQRLTLPSDKAAVVQLDGDARDVLVSNPDIVDAVVRNPRRIFLLAKKTGQTNAFFFDAAGRQLLTLEIRVEKDVTDLAALIRSNVGGSTIKVSALNDNVVLTGTVTSALEATRAADLAARFAGTPEKVVNMLQVTGGEQVLLKVRVAEMQRNLAKQFGVDITGAASIAGVPVVASTSNPFSLLGRALSDLSNLQAGSYCFDDLNTSPCAPNRSPGAGTLKALERVGLVHTLAEPNLTAVSGETAKFLAGGEFPVPTQKDKDGNVILTYKPFGVGLSFTPIVLSGGRISVQISTEVSELTNDNAFLLEGGTTTDANGNKTTAPGLAFPALSVRRAETTVEMPSGGSFVIAGLMQHKSKQDLNAYPGLKDMPILGALFRSRDYQNNESELVVLVSTYLVSPKSEAAFTTPLDGYVSPTDMETIMLGRLNAVYKDKNKTPQPKPPGSVGFIVQ